VQRFAATEVTAMTATPSPIWRLRAEAKNEKTAAVTMMMLQGLTRPLGPLCRSPDSPFIATSEIPNPSPAAIPSSTPGCARMRSIRWEKTKTRPRPTAMPSKMIVPASE
jgi:hypothetical protein